MPLPPMGGAAMDDCAEAVVSGKSVVTVPLYVTPVGSLLQLVPVWPSVAVGVDQVPVGVV